MRRIAGLARGMVRAMRVIPALVVACLVASPAEAEPAAICGQLMEQLSALDQNSDFQGQTGNDSELKSLERQVQRSESAYIRQGCNDDAKARRPLTPECRVLARAITEGRKSIEALSRTVETGDAVARQREAVLQQMSRFGCDRREAQTQRDKGNLFDQLFNAIGDAFDGAGGVRGDDFDPYGNYHTVRTLCVRKTDGFYWPISYSTLVDYVPADAEQCRAMCPSLDVDLYYYDNPGQEPDQMINQYGEPYTALPNAFKFRTAYDKDSKCQSTVEYGQIALTEMGGGVTRAMVTFRGESFPLPLRDPRGRATVVATAQPDASVYVEVPLPRRRPPAPGEAVTAEAIPSTRPLNDAGRVIDFNGKRVRLVGPDTPYGRSAAGST